MIIKEYLARKGMTQKTFAEMLGVDRSFLNQVLNGKRKLSPQHALHVPKITEGLVTRDEALFPELYTDWKLS